MERKLSEMTLEELWALFPITLTEHKACWGEWYAAEKKRILELLPAGKCRISHIGSTAISQIRAKPIIDILLEIPQEASMEEAKQRLVCNGYICMREEPGRKDFNRGYTPQGFAERVFHLHLRYWGDNDELYFRDLMNDRPDLAERYEELKLSLWKKFERDRDAYTDAKGGFIRAQTMAAKDIYKGRYAGASQD